MNASGGKGQEGARWRGWERRPIPASSRGRRAPPPPKLSPPTSPAARPRPPAARPRSHSGLSRRALARVAAHPHHLPPPPPQSTARRRLQAAGGALHCSAAAEGGGSGRCLSAPGPPLAYLCVRAECGAPGRGVPSWTDRLARAGGWGRLSAPARPRSAPLASSVTMDISRLRRRPLLALGETPLGRQLHRRHGDQLG